MRKQILALHSASRISAISASILTPRAPSTSAVPVLEEAARLPCLAAGVPVAKHGNRAASSKTGTADVLGALGVNIDADMALIREALWSANICFLMATRHHNAMRHVGPSRV